MAKSKSTSPRNPSTITSPLVRYVDHEGTSHYKSFDLKDKTVKSAIRMLVNGDAKITGFGYGNLTHLALALNANGHKDAKACLDTAYAVMKARSKQKLKRKTAKKQTPIFVQALKDARKGKGKVKGKGKGKKSASVETQETSLEDMTLAQLREIATPLGIKGRSKVSLVERINMHMSAQAVEDEPKRKRKSSKKSKASKKAVELTLEEQVKANASAIARMESGMNQILEMLKANA